MLLALAYLSLHRILELVVWSRRSEIDKEREIVVLRHQIHILERQLGQRVQYRAADRVILAALGRDTASASTAQGHRRRIVRIRGRGVWILSKIGLEVR